MRHRHFPPCIVFTLGMGLLFAAPLARAELLAYEGFNYESGTTIAGQSGGTPVSDYGWAGAWRFQSGKSGNMNMASNAVPERAGVVSTGNCAIYQRLLLRTLGTTIGGPSAGTVWCGFFLRPLENNCPLKFALQSGSSDVLSVYFTVASKKFGDINFGGESTGVTGSTGTRFFLIRMDFGAQSATSYLWINPDVTAGEPAVETATATRNHETPWTFNGISVGTENTTYKQVDEIRIGTTFRDAVCATEHADPTTIVLIR